MKKVILSIVLLLSIGTAFAQKSNVKAAKSAAEAEKPDFDKAQSLINQALTNSETMNDPETWNTAGQIQKSIVAKQQEKRYLRQAYDTLTYYNGIYSMSKYFLKCDSLAQIPNEKGKIKNKYRKDNATLIAQDRSDLINGGITYINVSNNKLAKKFFGMYIDLATAPMMEVKDQKADTLLSTIAHYASMAGARDNDWAYVVKYAPTALTGKTEEASAAMKLLANGYQELKDSTKWISVLKDGITKYPTDDYFFRNLINYYSNKGNTDDAQKIADDMIAKDPTNSFYLYVKGYLFQVSKKYDEAVKYYKQATDKKPDYAEAWSNMAGSYLSKAMEIDANTSSNPNDPAYRKNQGMIKALYGMAKPCYEKARELKPEAKNLWLAGLYTVYYRLGINGPDFEQLTKMIEEQNKK